MMIARQGHQNRFAVMTDYVYNGNLSDVFDLPKPNIDFIFCRNLFVDLLFCFTSASPSICLAIRILDGN